MNEDILKSIDKRLATLTNLVAINVIKDKSLQEQIDILYNAHLNVNEIAEILGKTQNTVNVTLSQARKKKDE